MKGPVGLAGRIGITTGEVLVAGPEQPLIGDTMNTAARLQAAAEPGEILIGEPTYRLVQDAVVAETVEPLPKKADAFPRIGGAGRLLSPIGRDAWALRLGAPESAIEQRSNHSVGSSVPLFTVSARRSRQSRLVEEFSRASTAPTSWAVPARGASPTSRWRGVGGAPRRFR
jgi:hypothetical protein